MGGEKGYLTSDMMHWLLKAGQKEIEQEIDKKKVSVRVKDSDKVRT